MRRRASPPFDKCLSTIVCTAAAAALLEIISDLIKESREEEEEDSYVFRPSHQVRCYFFLLPIFKRSFDEGPAMDYYFSIFYFFGGGVERGG
jgi:hypothetical protein